MAPNPVLCATSLARTATLDVASALAKHRAAALEIVHVAPGWPDLGPLVGERSSHTNAVEVGEAQQRRAQHLAASRARLADGLECRTMLLEGRTGLAVTGAARALGAAYIVVGRGPARGDRGGAATAVGVTTLQILRHAEHPVLVSTGASPLPAGGVWVVGAPCTRAARGLLRSAQQMAGPGGRVVVVHGVGLPGGAPAQALEAFRQRRLQHLRELLEDPNVEIQIGEGEPARELLAAVARWDASGVVLGSQQGRGPGSTGMALLQRAGVPVLFQVGVDR